MSVESCADYGWIYEETGKIIFDILGEFRENDACVQEIGVV